MSKRYCPEPKADTELDMSKIRTPPQILKDLTYTGGEVMKVIEALDLDLYRPQGTTDGDL